MDERYKTWEETYVLIRAWDGSLNLNKRDEENPKRPQCQTKWNVQHILYVSQTKVQYLIYNCKDIILVNK